MSRRSIIKKFQVLNDADSAANPESEPTDVSGVDFITYEIAIDVTVDANLEVEFCNDTNSDGEYKPLNFNQSTPLDGGSHTDYLVHIENKGFKWMKLVVSDNGGTGNVNAWITGTVRGS